MTNSFEFKAKVRSLVGTGAARALRRENQVPGVIYGDTDPPLHIALDHNKVIKQLEQESIYSHVLTVDVDGKQQQTILKGLQRHPSKPIVLHMDFQRVSKTHKLRVHVPLHFLGEARAVGVKKGGLVTHNMVDVEVSCLPGDLPEFIEVDVSGLDIGESVNLSELKIPIAVEIVALTHGDERRIPVATVQVAKSEIEPQPSEDGDADVDADADADAEGDAAP